VRAEFRRGGLSLLCSRLRGGLPFGRGLDQGPQARELRGMGIVGEAAGDQHIEACLHRLARRGGHPALGYDVRDRKLVVNPTEAELVRLIFRRFLDPGSALPADQGAERSGPPHQVVDHAGRQPLRRVAAVSGLGAPAPRTWLPRRTSTTMPTLEEKGALGQRHRTARCIVRPMVGLALGRDGMLLRHACRSGLPGEARLLCP
jgi:hypothetical protein